MVGSPHPSPAGTRVTWLGHASVIVDVGGTRILFDPTLRPRLLHLRRPTFVDHAHVRGIDATFISHAHHDHLDLASIRLVRRDNPGSTLHAPSSASNVLRKAHVESVTTVAIGDRITVGDVTIDVAFAAHEGTRTGHRRDPSTPSSVSYVVTGPDGTRTWFAGDTELDSGLAGIGPVDIALVPVGGWKKLGPGHMDPTDAARAVQLVGARVAVPIHWGTFHPMLLRRAMDASWSAAPTAFTHSCAAVDPSIDVRILQPGESTRIPALKERHHGIA